MKKIGFIGQGFIGNAYANDFESRGYEVVRYAKEDKYIHNKDIIATCDIVFIAVPTPTTTKGFSFDIVREVLSLVGKGKLAVIKSTLLPGTTDLLQQEFPDIFIIHSPEFLRAKSAQEDAKKPQRNIVGYTTVSKERAQEILDVLPYAPYNKILPAVDAEMIKYMGNIFLMQKVVFANCFFDLAQKLGADYEAIREAVGVDSRITPSHLSISQDGGRGAGGFCFIKDFAAFREMYEKQVGEKAAIEMLKSMEKRNAYLLKSTNKSMDVLREVYGDGILN